MTSWRCSIVTSAFVLAFVLVGGGARANAEERVVANIPFDFIAGESLLPAGDYIIDMLSDGIVGVSSVDGRHNTLLLTIAAQAGDDEPIGQLAFTRFEGQHFLAAVTADESTRREVLLTASSMARELRAMGLNE
jgi:hypothetical protein